MPPPDGLRRDDIPGVPGRGNDEQLTQSCLMVLAGYSTWALDSGSARQHARFVVLLPVSERPYRSAG